MITYRNILLAVDMEPESAATIDYAFAFAEKLGAVVHTLHANPSGGTSIVAGLDAEEQAANEQAKRRLQRALASHNASASMGQCLVHSSEPINAVLKTAASLSADLIILSTHARHGVARLITGSVALGVLHEAKVPVLIMRSPPKSTGDRPPSANEPPHA